MYQSWGPRFRAKSAKPRIVSVRLLARTRRPACGIGFRAARDCCVIGVRSSTSKRRYDPSSSIGQLPRQRLNPVREKPCAVRSSIHHEAATRPQIFAYGADSRSVARSRLHLRLAAARPCVLGAAKMSRTSSSSSSPRQEAARRALRGRRRGTCRSWRSCRRRGWAALVRVAADVDQRARASGQGRPAVPRSAARLHARSGWARR